MTITQVSPGLSSRSRWRSSHAVLVRDASRAYSPPAGTESGRVDAVVVPASRGGQALGGAAVLAARTGATLVVLCSAETSAADAAARVAAVRGCRAVVAAVPPGYSHGLLPTRTGSATFHALSAHRSSDLGIKRNVGLMAARLLGWRKIVFLDDDIGPGSAAEQPCVDLPVMRRLAHQLESHQIAGLACYDFPDNSVVCHARRLAGLAQDTFVSGAALGVNCSDQPLPLFPEIYNEDWFFFSRLAAGRELAHVGTAIQAPYDPFDGAGRAQQQEFGDLLAEGLFALFETQPDEMPYADRLLAAGASFWARCIEARAASVQETRERLGSALDVVPDEVRTTMRAALRSLTAAQEQLATVGPDDCVDFLDAWQADLLDWQRGTQRIRGVPDVAEAADVLGLREWYEVGPRAEETALPLVS